MGTATLNPGQNKFGPGTIYLSPVGTAFPTLVASGGKFTQAWTGWLGVGGTASGLTLTRNPATADFVVAESYYPQHILTTGDDIQGAFTLAQVNKANLAMAMNGGDAASVAGTGGNYTTAGTGGATISGFSAPLIGKEVRCQFGWQGQDDDEVVFIYQCLNVASVALSMNKGAAAQELAFTLRGELPATNPDTNNGYSSGNVIPWRWYFAGTAF